MSSREKTILVSFISYVLILGYFLVNWIQIYQSNGLEPAKIFNLWGTVIVAVIVMNIAGNILIRIISAIILAAKTKLDKEEPELADERDTLIELKGTKVSYLVFSIGVLGAMLTFVFNQPPLVMFSLIIAFSLAAEIVGDMAQYFLYRRGF
jgi:hypothetical protein